MAKKKSIVKKSPKKAKKRLAKKRKSSLKRKKPSALKFSLDMMGNGPAVASAVAYQLNIERRWPPNDVTKVMSTEYRYDQFTIANFLKGVQGHLLQGTPSYTLSFDGAFVGQALQATVGALMNGIAARTH
jgi:hypothetical protein